MLFINIKESWVHLDWLTKCYQWQDKILTATIHLLHFYLIQVSQKKVFVLLWFHVTWEPRLQKQNTFLNLPGIKKKTQTIIETICLDDKGSKQGFHIVQILQ